MGDRGGTATRTLNGPTSPRLYPMGDRGGTATGGWLQSARFHYTRWEIGGEPQHSLSDTPGMYIIPDGRSGGNRNSCDRLHRLREYYTRWEIGGEPQHYADDGQIRADYTRWEIGGEPQHVDLYTITGGLYPMGDRGGTATC